MWLIALFCAGLLIGAALIQWTIARLFATAFLKRQPVPRSAEQPKAAILMTLRGCDPSLMGSLSAALMQEHADYEVHVVVDHPTDPAWSVVESVKQSHPMGERLHIHQMSPPRETCSLKCHSLVQAYEMLQGVEHVALLDADVTPHRSWLSELTDPLADPDVGGVTGAQWFEPPNGARFGSWLRSSWSGGAMVPTIHFCNPWAGSCAMRWQDMRDSGLIDRWTTTIVDDGPIRDSLAQIGRRVEFAPSLIMVNRESCSTRYAINWTTRMLTWSRLFESTFYLSVLHAVFSNFVMWSNVFFLLAGIVGMGIGTPGAGWWSLAGAVGLLGSGLLCVHAYWLARKCTRYSCQLRQKTLAPFRFYQGWMTLLACGPAHLVYAIATFRALSLNQVTWRRIRYQISGKHIRRVNYEPFVNQDSAPTHSL